jgi:hypothetical protein
MTKSLRDHINESFDDFSQAEMVALHALATGAATLREACRVAHCSPSVLIRKRDELGQLFRLLREEEGRMDAIFNDTGWQAGRRQWEEFTLRGADEDYVI